MRVAGVVVVLVTLVLGAGLPAQADVFTISGVGWPGASATGTPNSGADIGEFLQNCAVFNGEGLSPCNIFADPTIRISLGGDPTDLTSLATFVVPINGDGVLGGAADEFNNVSGVTFTDILLNFTNVTVQVGTIFECFAGGPNDAFSQCGFQDDHGSQVISLSALFTGPPGIPSSSVPEPASWVLLSSAAVVAAIIRRKSRRVA